MVDIAVPVRVFPRQHGSSSGIVKSIVIVVGESIDDSVTCCISTAGFESIS